MTEYQYAFGKHGEDLAALHLKRRGYDIVEKNYRSPDGEIDIIAKEEETLVFIEVKTRSNLAFGAPKGSVTRSKQKKISLTALHYLKETGQMHQKARFDVVSIIIGKKRQKIEIIKNAFELQY